MMLLKATNDASTTAVNISGLALTTTSSQFVPVDKQGKGEVEGRSGAGPGE